MLVKDLCDRYHLSSRKSLYSRLNALGLELTKDRQGRADATPEQVELLDQLDNHLKQGGTLKNFTPALPVQVMPHTAQPTTQHSNDVGDIEVSALTTQLTQHTTQVQLTPELLGEIIEKILEKIQPSDPIHYMTILDRAAAADWLLSTSEVERLIQVKPRTKKNETTFIRGSWCFIKSGKVGNETGWKVMKKSAISESVAT